MIFSYQHFKNLSTFRNRIVHLWNKSIYIIYFYCRFKYLVLIRRLKPVVLAKERGECFNVLLAASKGKDKQVVKIFNHEKWLGYLIYKKLRNTKIFHEYCSALHQAKELPFIGEHSCRLIKIDKLGGYTTEYIEGYNLAYLPKLSHMSEAKVKKQDILHAIDVLILALEKYCKKRRRLTGDWMIHNLLYDVKNKKIVNINLEGFHTYSAPVEENDINLLKGRLNHARDSIK